MKSREALVRAASRFRFAPMHPRLRTVLLIALVIAVAIGLSLDPSVTRSCSLSLLAGLVALTHGPVVRQGSAPPRRATRS